MYLHIHVCIQRLPLVVAGLDTNCQLIVNLKCKVINRQLVKNGETSDYRPTCGGPQYTILYSVKIITPGIGHQ